MVHIAPWFTATRLLSDEVTEFLKQGRTEFATVEDGADALMKILSDTTISGTCDSNLRTFFPSHYRLDRSISGHCASKLWRQGLC